MTEAGPGLERGRADVCRELFGPGGGGGRGPVRGRDAEREPRPGGTAPQSREGGVAHGAVLQRRDGDGGGIVREGDG